MELVVIRGETTETSTFGKLYVNGLFSCFTLEDTDRKLEAGGEKVPGETCIPRGKYNVIIDWSNRFKKEMIHVLDVPGFEGIRVHAGNTNEATSGCLLLGNGKAKEYLLDSRSAVNKVFALVEGALDRGETVTLEVK